MFEILARITKEDTVLDYPFIASEKAEKLMASKTSNKFLNNAFVLDKAFSKNDFSNGDAGPRHAGIHAPDLEAASPLGS